MSGSDIERSATILTGLLVALLLSAGVAAGSGTAVDRADGTTGSITDVRYTHAADTVGDTTYLWNHTAGGDTVETSVVRVETSSASKTSRVCLSQNDTTTCRTLGADGTASFELSRDATLPARVDITLTDGVTGNTIDTESHALEAISRLGDYDQDGLNNTDEVRLGGDLTAVDTDGDGIRDGVEHSTYNTSITESDTDQDGLSDARELFEHGTSPTDADTDGDGVTDDAEVAAGYNATAPDTDGDGLLDGEELSAGTDPTVADTDGDGLNDGRERRLGTDPTTADTDQDGLGDGDEVDRGTDPLTADTDDDGLADSDEVGLGSDPLDADTDDDGLADGREAAAGTALLRPDTDGDGLEDGREQQLGTDPTAVDSDGDYLTDGVESTVGTDPTSNLTLVWLSALLAALGCAALGALSVDRGYVGGAVDRLRTIERAVRRRTPTTADVAARPAHAATGPGHTGSSVTDADHTGDGSPAESPEAAFEALSDDGLTTDSEIVTEMLKGAGGRMKQAHIVEATDWSKAKVSRLLSRKADDGDIVKLRLGRENLICLEDARPAVTTTDRRTDSGLSPPDSPISGGI